MGLLRDTAGWCLKELVLVKGAVWNCDLLDGYVGCHCIIELFV
jgi:hypothetical protein